jgi:hypothetical protein
MRTKNEYDYMTLAARHMLVLFCYCKKGSFNQPEYEHTHVLEAGPDASQHICMLENVNIDPKPNIR